MPLIANTYGKGRVRVLRVHRQGEHNEVRELSLQVMLNGDFSRAYTHADNRKVIATDTIKNIVNIVARESIVAGNEEFCAAIARFFLGRYEQVDSVDINASETVWRRMVIDGEEHPHGFVLDGNGKPTVHLLQGRQDAKLSSGIAGFTFMKSTDSGWTDYVMDDVTTLRETTDRIAATSMNASWAWSAEPDNYAQSNEKILATMLSVFADTYSAGIQDSLCRMAEAALAAVPEIGTISLACPNKHYLPIDLSPFGMSADNLVFTPTDEPHGQIECSVGR